MYLKRPSISHHFQDYLNGEPSVKRRSKSALHTDDLHALFLTICEQNQQAPLQCYLKQGDHHPQAIHISRCNDRCMASVLQTLSQTTATIVHFQHNAAIQDRGI